MNKKFILVGFVFLCLFSQIVFSMSISDLNLNSSSLSVGGKLILVATISNSELNNAVLQSIIIGDGLPAGTISFDVNSSAQRIVLYDFVIGSDYRNVDYNVFVRLVKPNLNDNEIEVVYDSKVVTFSVRGALEDFSFRAMTCLNVECFSDEKVFDSGSNVYFDIDSVLVDANVVGELVYPSGRNVIVKIPSSLKLSEIGSYILNISAKMDGYRDASDSVVFGVIKSGIFPSTGSAGDESSLEDIIDSEIGSNIDNNTDVVVNEFDRFFFEIVGIFIVVVIIFGFLFLFFKWSQERFVSSD